MRRVFALPAVLVLVLPLSAAVPAEPRSRPTEPVSRPAEPGDFNGDGRVDLAVGAPMANGRAGGSIVTFSGSDKGLVGSRRSVVPTRFDHILVSGDFNGDGYADLAVGPPYEIADDTMTTSVNRVLVFPGSRNGVTGRGGRALKAKAAWADYFGQALAVGDFNADGYADLAVADEEQVRVCYGSRQGLSLTRSTSLADGMYFGEVLASGDVTGDGITDLVATRGAEGPPEDEDDYDPDKLQKARLYIIPGRRTAGLRLRGAWSTRLSDRYFGARQLAVGDVDGDRRADVVTIMNDSDEHNSRGPTQLFRSRGRSLAPPELISHDDERAGLGDVTGDEQAALGDVTGDGRADLVTIDSVVPPGVPTLKIRAGTSMGLSREAQTLRTPEFTPVPDSFFLPFPLNLTLLNLAGDRRQEIVVGVVPRIGFVAPHHGEGYILLFRPGAWDHQTIKGPPKTAFGITLLQ